MADLETQLNQVVNLLLSMEKSLKSISKRLEQIEIKKSK